MVPVAHWECFSPSACDFMRMIVAAQMFILPRFLLVKVWEDRQEIERGAQRWDFMFIVELALDWGWALSLSPGFVGN